MSNETTANVRVKVGRFIFLGLAGLFVLCVTIQIFIAGMAVFTDASYWRYHVVFVRIFELFPILMLIFSFLGRLSKALRWWCVAIFILIYAQYFTAHFPGAGAFHPVMAAVLFSVSLLVFVKAKRSVSAREAKLS